MTETPLILLVDDSALQCKIYGSALKAQGYRVITGDNGLIGVELALLHHPDLILMDISMPQMDGLTAVRELRSHAEMAAVPILALTASTDPQELEMAQQAGYSDWVNKSGERSIVLEMVRQRLAAGP